MLILHCQIVAPDRREKLLDLVRLGFTLFRLKIQVVGALRVDVQKVIATTAIEPKTERFNESNEIPERHIRMRATP
ncbi:MAG: hypothetical protein WD042_01930 [Phycisphaeraceae bacterium]